MRDRRDNDGRVSKRSSTGIRRDSTAEKREPIRSFEEADGLYRDDRRRDDRDRYDDRRRDRYDDRRREDRDHYDDRRNDRYDDRREDCYDDRYDDRYEDRRRDHGREERSYDDMRRSSRREAPRWDEYRFDDEEERAPREERERRDDRNDRREVRDRKDTRRAPARRVGGDTELFVHQIVPYAMFWIALFAAVSFILRDMVGLGGSAGAFGSWLADALGGLMGPVAYLLPLWLVVLSLRWKVYVREGLLFKKLLLSAAFLWLLSGIVHVFRDGALRDTLNTEGLYASGALLQSGGLFGGFLGEWMGYILYLWGTILLAIPLLLIIGIYMIGMTPGGIWQRISCKLKMASDRRAQRRRELYDGDEERTLRVRGKDPNRLAEGNGEAEEPAPAEERVHYTFGTEEDDFAPRRDYENKLKTEPEAETVYTAPAAKEPEPAVQQEPAAEAPAPAATREPASRVHSATDIVDIPDDLPEIDEPVDDLQAILRGAGHHESAEDKLDQILREAAERSEQEAAAKAAMAAAEQAEEERPLQGTSYSPFALHQHFEPKQRPAEPAPAQEAPVQPAYEPAPAESRGSYLTEEALGSLNPIHRESKPAEAAPAAAEEVLAYRPAPATVEARPAEGAAYTAAYEEPRRVPLASELIIETSPVAEPTVVPAPVAAPAPTPTPAPTVEPVAPAATEPEPAVGGFSFTDEEASAPAVAVGTHTAFAPVEAAEPAAPAVAFAREEVAPVPEPAAPQRPAVPERPRTIAMQPKAQVLTRTEPVEDKKEPTPPPPPREYRLPPISLLNEDKAVRDDDHSEENQEKIDILRRTLESFNVHIKDEVICSRGPTITRYEVRPEIGVPVRSIMNRIDDISLYMEAQVRIAPVQGKAAVGVEVPNKVRETVYLRTLLESEAFKKSKNPVEVALGVGIGGNIQMCDLTAMPHLLVAGATKSGKSVCINTIILSLLYKTSPQDLRLILIDPKRVEFKPYMHLPHLYAPIITEPAHAVGALACAVQEMERRYSLLEDVGARNFEGYNEKVKNDPEREHLPYLVIIIDEYYDLKMACPNNDLENFACRLAQKARAAGIHLIIGTQRPSVNVITGTLKANIPSRIAFTVMQQVDSRTILDAVGAELLTGRGDMLYAPMGEKPIRLQGSYVTDDEVESVVSFVRDRNDPVQYNQAFMDQIEVEVARAANAGKKNDDFDDLDDEDSGDEDPKFFDAVVLAVQTQKVATSLLQRRLGVGYGRAAKIIDRMEELGLVTPAEGNKPRKLLPAAQSYLDHMASAGDEDEGAEGVY